MNAREEKIRLFEEVPVPQAVAKLAIPTVLSSLVSLIYNLADAYFVGLLNDPVQTAAVSLVAPVTLAFSAVTNLFGTGSASMMSRALGRKDMRTLRESSAFGFYGALFTGILFSVLCTLFLQPLLALLGADSSTAPVTARYMRWTVCLGAAPSIVTIVLAQMIRSEGAALHASIGSMSGCVLNMVLDPIFVLPFGLNMGAEGAAMATLISNCFSLSYALGYLYVKRKSTFVCISPKAFTLRRPISGGVCAIGIPACIQTSLNVASQMILNNLAAGYGAAAMAGMGIAYRISMIPWHISHAISMGVMPLVGYTFASKRIPRMKHALSHAIKLSQCVLWATTIFCCVFPSLVVRLFIQEPQSVAYGSAFLIAQSLSIPLLGFDFMTIGAFQAVGKGSNALLMSTCRKLVLQIPATFLLNMLWPLYGLAYAQLVAEIGMGVLSFILLKRLIRQIEHSMEVPV